MDSFELNKIIAAILLTALIIIGINKFSDFLFFVEKPEVSAYKVEGLEAKNTGEVSSADTLKKEVKVVFDGSLPDLFREGQGIVAEGIFKNNNFVASEVLAKHDENYMPPEVADALKKNNVWKGDSN